MSGINININLNLQKNKVAKPILDKSCEGKLKKKKKKNKQIQNSNAGSPLPWGLNQERLKNYIFQQLEKRDNLLFQQQLRKIKKEEPKQDRREILGVSFLNHMPKNKIKQMINKHKVTFNDESQQPISKFSDEELYQIRLYKEWKQKQIKFEMQVKQQQEFERQMKIQQNLQNLNEFIKYRNQVTSVHQKKSVSFHKQKRAKSSLLEKRKKDEFYQKYQDIANRYEQIILEQRDNQSCFGLGLDSDQEGLSQMNSIQKSTRRQNVISEPTLDEDEEQQIQELGNIEKEMAQIVKAAIIIQKTWRGYKTRQILLYYQTYIDENDIKQNHITPSISSRQSQIEPICQSVQIGQEQSAQKSSQKKLDKVDYNTFIEQLDWEEENQDQFDEKNQFSSQKLSSIKKLTQQKSNHKIIIEKQKQKWHEMLDHISQLQRKGSKQNIKEVLSDLKLFTLKITKEMDVQNSIEQEEKRTTPIEKSVEVSELRQALGSEQLMKLSQTSSPLNKDASLFEQNPFLDFASKKFKELLNRQNMNKLIKMRETAIEERHRNELKTIQEALQHQQISPKSFEKQKFRLEKWVTKEKEDFKQQKQSIENGWKGLYETFMRTQKDLLFMSKLNNQQLVSSFSSENISNARLVREITSASQSKIIKTNNFDTATMNVSPSICESQDIRKVPKTSPSPSPRHQQINQQQIYENLEWDDDMLYTSDNLDYSKQPQSQVIKISTLINKEPELTDSQVQSYSILIANSIVGNEIQEMFEELIKKNKDITVFAKQATINKGIKTNIQSVKGYLSEVEKFLLEKNGSDILLERINVPLGPTPIELLKFFHYYEDEDEIESNEQNDYSNQAILTTDQFAKLEQRLMEQDLSTDDDFLIELEHVHNKVLFDALNEALDYYRPFGLNGYPLPWIKQPLELIQRNKKQSSLKSLLEGATKKVIEWGSSLVGLMLDKPDSPFPKILMFDQEYLNQIREERMIRMLNAEVYDNEERWLQYDEESSEILIDITIMIQEELIFEVVKELIQFQ